MSHHTPRTYEFRVDVGFTPEQKFLFLHALDTWAQYFGNEIAFNARFGDFENPNVVVVGAGDPMIVRADKAHHVKCAECFTLGLYDPSGDRLLFVTDRIESPVDFFEVALHEIGHAMAMEHVDDKKSIMKPHHTVPSAQCPSKADAIEFCRRHYCTLTDVSWCSE